MCEMPLGKIFVADLCMHDGLIKIGKLCAYDLL